MDSLECIIIITEETIPFYNDYDDYNNNEEDDDDGEDDNGGRLN